MTSLHTFTSNNEEPYHLKNEKSNQQKKCQQVIRIIKHLRDQIEITESDQIARPSDWLTEQLVTNAFNYINHNSQYDWHNTIYQTLRTIVNHLDQFRICSSTPTEPFKQQLLFPNREKITPQQVKVFALRLLNLMDYQEHQFK